MLIVTVHTVTIRQRWSGHYYETDSNGDSPVVELEVSLALVDGWVSKIT